MKKHNFLISKMQKMFASARLLIIIVLVAFLFNVGAYSQQVIGSFPYMNGGFEGQAAGALGTTVSPTLWSRQSQAGSSTTISTSSPRTGLSYATVTANASTSRNLQSPQLTPFDANSTLKASTSYVVQYWMKNAATVAAFQVAPTTNGTGNPTYSTSITMPVNPVWTKYTSVLTTAVTVVASSGIAVIGRSTIGTFDIDDAVIYAGTTADNILPDAPTSPTITNVVTGVSQTVSWTAPATGVDGGGYMVVRNTTDPSTAPNGNGIYATGNFITGTDKVVYIGTATTFSDALPGAGNYYYRIYTVDKAFNYSASSATINNSNTSTTLASIPSTQVSNLTFTNANSSSVTLNFTSGDGSNSLVVMRANAPITSDPVDGTTYSTQSNISGGTQVVYKGSANNPTITGLTKGTTYYFKVYTFNGAAGTEKYLTTNPASNSQDIIGNTITTAQSGPWATASTWTGGVLPTATDNVVIQNGHTVDMQASNTPVFNVTINNGGKLYSSIIASTCNLQVYGSKLQCDGTLGDPTITGANGSYIFIDFANNLTISGAGTINIYKVRPVGGYQNIGVTFASNTNITYATASIISDNGSNDNVTFTVNKDVTLGIAGNMNTTSSTGTNGTASTTWNINGTVNVAGFFSPIVTSAKTFTCNIGTTGSLTVLNVPPTVAGGASPTINVASGGTFTVTGTNCDLSGPAMPVITGAGTFATSSTVGVKIANASGLDTSTGPIRTSTINFNPTTSFTYGNYATQSSTTTSGSTAVTLAASNALILVGMGVSGTGITAGTTVSIVSGTAVTLSQNATAAGTNTLTYYSTTLSAQNTGNGLPSTINAITFINPTGVTLTNSTTVNSTLSLTAGTLYVGSGNTLTLKSSRAGSGYIDGTAGTITYAGTASQTASNLVNVNNLELNNTASSLPGVTLSSAATVSGTLTLTAGAIFNGGSNPNITMADGAKIECAGGSFSSKAPVFGTSVNLTYSGASPLTTGFELPTSSSVLSNLTINNATGVTLAGNATVNGALTLTSGTLTTGANMLSLKGTTTGSGAIIATSTNSTLNYNGSSAQTISNLTSNTVNNLTINNSSGVTLGASATVNGTLTLTSGLLSTGANTITVGSAGNISGASSSNYINGNLAMIYNATGSETFPVGKGGNYRPVTINATALDITPSTFTIYQTESAFSGTLPANTTSTLARNWTVAQTGSSAYAFDLTLDGTGFSPVATPVILQNNAGTISSYNTTGTYTASGLSSVGSFGLGDYTTPAPAITSFTPTSAANGTSVVITGTNFTSASAVSFGGTAATSYTIDSDTQITAVVGSSASGSVSVTTPGGTGTKTGFTWLEPTTTISTSKNATDLSLTSSSVVTVTSGTTFTINQNTSANSITVNPGGKITLGSGKTLTSQTLTLQSNSGGTATFVDNNNVTPQAITATVEQYMPQGRNWYTASPIGSGTTSNWNTGSSVVSYNEEFSRWDTETGSLSPGRGYISVSNSGSGTSNISFNGALNTGTVTTSVTRLGSTKSGFNLVGNPYPSYLDWSMVDTTTAKITSTIWYRTKTAANAYTFDTYNGVDNVATTNGINTVSKLIPPMQAFWVRVKAGETSGILTFDNTMRKHADVAENRLKAPSQKNSTQQVLRLQVSNGINSDETIVLFNANASNGYDAYDSQKMSNGNAAIPEIFTTVGNENLVINGLNSITLDMELPLGFTTGESNAFTIKATEMSNFDANTNVILKDNLRNTDYNLTSGSAYNFTSDIVSANTSRFSVIFKSASIATGIKTNSDDSNMMLVYKNSNNQISVKCQTGLIGQGTISVYNAVGQKLENKSVTSSTTILDNIYTSGVYVVSILVNGKTTTQRVIID